jgi:hypothetical protein
MTGTEIPAGAATHAAPHQDKPEDRNSALILDQTQLPALLFTIFLSTLDPVLWTKN